MHIVEKILIYVEPYLKTKYGITEIDAEDWKLFKEPLTDDSGHLSERKFRSRQEISVEIIEGILDIHGKAEVARFLGRLALLELRIRELQPWVRDHVVHAINTFLLGVYILETVHFPKACGARSDYPFMWKLCGPTHDLGYPIEIAHNVSIQLTNEINSILNEIHSPSPQVELAIHPKNLELLVDGRNSIEIIQNRLKEWALDIDISDYSNWLRAHRRIDHGLISALAQLKVVDAIYHKFNPGRKYEDIYQFHAAQNKFLNFNQQNYDLDVVSASAALFLHNIDPKYPGFVNKIFFKNAPLAFLLLLCDTIQEWDRYVEDGPVYSGTDFDITCTTSSLSVQVPLPLVDKISDSIARRLAGLTISINARTVTL